jgi:AraC-like DNA-binding protein
MTEATKKNVFFQDMDRLNEPLEVFIHQETKTAGAVGAHWHYYLEMLYILNGTVEAQCDQQTYTLSPGDMILFYPQSVHSMHRSPHASNPDEDIRYFVVMIDLNFLNITSEYRTRFSKLFRIAYQQNPDYIHFRKKELQDLPILQLLTHSLEENRNHTYGYDVLICSDIASLLTYLMRCLQKKGVDTDTIITAPDELDASIYSISKYIKQHCGEPLRVHELAQMCGMSYSYFAKLFRDTYNQSCKEYIEFTRINKVTDLLLFTNQDLTYISQEAGFSDCSHLIRTFKKWRGVTPKQWRKTIKE